MRTFLILLASLCLLTTASEAQTQQFYFFSAKDSLIRPNNTSAYTAGMTVTDTLSTQKKVLVFNLKNAVGNTVRAGAAFRIENLRAFCDTSVAMTFNVHLYSDSTAIPRIADRTNFTMANASYAHKYLGMVAVTTGATVAQSVGYGYASFAGLVFKLPATSSTIYGVVEAGAGWNTKAYSKYIFEIIGLYQ